MWEWIERGGTFMWPIVTCSVVALAVMIERLVVLLRHSSHAAGLENELRPLLRKGELGAASAACDQAGGPVGRVLHTVCASLRLAREDREQVVETAIAREVRRLEVRIRAVEVVGRVAPLLGLLGTVVGLVVAFKIVGESTGRVEPALLAGGIWQALITTVAGLIVAVPAMLFHEWYEGRVDALEFRMREAAASLLVNDEGKAGREHGRVHAPAQVA